MRASDHTALALLSAGGIVGMLLADGPWDSVFLLLTALPLVIGGWRVYALRGDAFKAPNRVGGQLHD